MRREFWPPAHLGPRFDPQRPLTSQTRAATTSPLHPSRARTAAQALNTMTRDQQPLHSVMSQPPTASRRPWKRQYLRRKYDASRPKTTCQWEVRYKCAVKLPTGDRSAIGCRKAWAKKCSLGIPSPRGDGLVGHLGLAALHKERRCPCFRVDYGAVAHRWCAGGIHFEGARLCRRGECGGEDSKLKRLEGSLDTRITDFFSPAEEQRKVKEGNTASRQSEGEGLKPDDIEFVFSSWCILCYYHT